MTAQPMAITATGMMTEAAIFVTSELPVSPSIHALSKVKDDSALDMCCICTQTLPSLDLATVDYSMQRVRTSRFRGGGGPSGRWHAGQGAEARELHVVNTMALTL